MVSRNFVWVLVVGLASIVCWQAAQSAPQHEEDGELYRLFVDAVEHVDRSYVKPIERRKLVEAAIHGMLDSLDPYSNFISRDDRGQFDKTTSGHFGGIGVQVDVRAGDVRVVSPMVGTPAYEAGVLAGDRILKVNGVVLDRTVLGDVVTKISGVPGTQVTLTIQHAPYNMPAIDVTLTRQVINVESVRGLLHNDRDEWDYVIDKDKRIAYVRVTAFNPNTEIDLEKVLRGLLKQGDLKGLILDLRFNPGGLLTSAVKVSDLFISEGKIVSTKGRGNTPERIFSAVASDTLPNFPMVVLVNRFSASAAEIVSACLQDHNRAVIVGERTWGKGSVQNVIDLEEGKSAIKLTVASYNRPNGRNIHRFKDMKDDEEWGVKPNPGYEVYFTPQQMQDYQLWRGERDMVVGKRRDPPPKSSAPKPPAPKDFDDKQLAKALEAVRAKLAKP